jgi:hypothetical protein
MLRVPSGRPFKTSIPYLFFVARVPASAGNFGFNLLPNRARRVKLRQFCQRFVRKASGVAGPLLRCLFVGCVAIYVRASSVYGRCALSARPRSSRVACEC